MISLKDLNFEKKILNSLSPISEKKVILACSGGADSLFLLKVLEDFYGADFSRYVIVAHIHHGLRESADRDEEIVKNYCIEHRLTYECLRANISQEAKKTKTSIEECARNVRKEWLERIRMNRKAEYILTAHHRDDQAETLLYRITKGTSLTGLIGIERFAGKYFRPLLGVSKREILEYMQHHDICYGIDETNNDVSIPRNLIRHEVLPRLRTINSDVEGAIERLGNSARDIREGFDIFFSDIGEKKECDYDWYLSLPLGFQHELLRYLYVVGNGSTHGLSLALLLELDKFLSTRTGGKKEFGKKWLVKKHGTIYLT